jgi:hypothetical protein
MEEHNPTEQMEEFAPQELFFNDVFGYTLITTVVVCTYTIINMVLFIA